MNGNGEPVCLEVLRPEPQGRGRFGRLAAVAAQAAAGIALGSAVGSHVSCTETTISGQGAELCATVTPLDWSGGTDLDLGFIDRYELPNTHHGPIHYSIRPEPFELRNPALRNLLRDPESLDHALNAVLTDAKRAAVPALMATSAKLLAGFTAVNVGLWMLGPAYERFKRRPGIGSAELGRGALRGAAVTLAAVLPAGGFILHSRQGDPLEGAYAEGLLGRAEALAGDLRNVANNFDQYSRQLAGKARYAFEVYQRVADLRVMPDRDQITRVLVEADNHCNIPAYDALHAIAEHADIDAVFSLGDSTDYGSDLEQSCLAPLDVFVDEDGKPIEVYWVKGNHDTTRTVRYVNESLDHVTAVGRQPIDVNGLTVVGGNDPRYSPNPGQNESRDTSVMRNFTQDLIARADSDHADVVLVHDNVVAQRVAEGGHGIGSVLAGHAHERSASMVGDTNLYVEGSSGAAGARAFQGDRPLTMQAAILSLDNRTGRIVGAELIDIDPYAAQPAVVISSLPAELLYTPPTTDEGDLASADTPR